MDAFDVVSPTESAFASVRKKGFDPVETLHRISHWLPQQGPIKDFVHHNTLHAFQHLKFPDAVRAAARLYGARATMPGSFYLDAYRSGVISELALEKVIESVFPNDDQRKAVRARLLSGPVESCRFAGLVGSGLRSAINRRLGEPSIDRLVQPPLFRLIGGYLDQGIAVWRMPDAERLGFFEAVSSLVSSSWLPVVPLDSAGARRLLMHSPQEALCEALQRIVGDEKFFESYLLEAMLAQPGWAGLVAECERHPESLLSQRAITLLDYAAVSLVIELGCLEKTLGADFKSLVQWAEAEGKSLPRFQNPDFVPERTETEALLEIWQEAYEWSYYQAVLGGVISIASDVPTAARQASSWAFFCIDDRECSLRRHVEEVDSSIGTFATAGFFGLDFMYRGAADSVPGKHCPVPITPRHLVVEEISSRSARRSPRLAQTLPLPGPTRTFFRGWILSYALDFGAALRLAANVFLPSLAPVRVPPLSTVHPKGHLKLTRPEGETLTESEGLLPGYSFEELADRIQKVLQSVGADERWPELAIFFGHGASSVNNPYFSAYNCGACSGRPGAPNARAFAEAANMPEVRCLLRGRGVNIPDDMWFVGALHDTTRDEVTYFDLDRVPERLRSRLVLFQKSVEAALARNAAERCRRFEKVSHPISPEHARDEVRNRAVSLFQPRPEYNHATNACCIIGRRRLTEGLFLDRRAFLNSYDPTKDPEGRILADILSAAVPVCGGINLEYYFSRIDPQVYGAGTKLPQNVTGLIGMTNGIEGDLLTGLPTQMTEIHDPIRLLMIVEHSPEVALLAAKSNPRIHEWIANEWIRYVCIDPGTSAVWVFTGGVMQKVEQVEVPGICWRNSLEAACFGRGNLPVGFIRAESETGGGR